MKKIIGIVAIACLVLVGGGIAFAFYLYQLPQMAPSTGATDVYVEIPQGSSATTVATILEEQEIIRSADFMLLSMRMFGNDNAIKSGTYFFDSPQSLGEVIERVTTSDYQLPSRTITLFEGEANFEYAERLGAAFPYVYADEFTREAAGMEGYLFPDTYTIPERATTVEVIEILRDNFDARIEPLEEQIAASPYSLDDIITMASLVETEAGNASYETKQRVAGVLWRRYDIGMLLQADAVFSYIYQEHLPRVLYEHLEVNSPYNLYKYTGLPPGPIGNPGIDSIRATLNPVNPENYLYYLTGNDGKFYYSRTLSGHEQNRRNYLRY